MFFLTFRHLLIVEFKVLHFYDYGNLCFSIFKCISQTLNLTLRLTVIGSEKVQKLAWTVLEYFVSITIFNLSKLTITLSKLGECSDLNILQRFRT